MIRPAMVLGWRKTVGVGLLLLAWVALLAPLAASSAPDPCMPGMMAASGEHEEAPGRCQWITPTSCCDETAMAGAPPGLSPPPATSVLRAASPSRLSQHRRQAPAAYPTSQAAALATTVLRL